MIFDTHCHLYDDKFEEGFFEAIQKCLDNGISLIMLIGDNIKDSLKCIEGAKAFEQVYCAIGIHPMDVDSIALEEVKPQIKALLNSKVKAIGEIGLDYYWNKEEETKIKQKKYFIEQIELANEVNLPIVIHARDSVEDCIRILKEHPCINKGVFHCYSGSLEQMKEILKLGFFIGLDGPVTYKNAVTPKEIARNVPLESLVVETDSPYLPPVPFRGKTNYPYYLPYIIKEIASLKGISEKEVEDATFENGKRLYRL